jgi:hypothetical protein
MAYKPSNKVNNRMSNTNLVKFEIRLDSGCIGRKYSKALAKVQTLMDELAAKGSLSDQYYKILKYLGFTRG